MSNYIPYYYLSSHNLSWSMSVEQAPEDLTMIYDHKRYINRANKFIMREQESYVLKSVPVSI